MKNKMDAKNPHKPNEEQAFEKLFQEAYKTEETYSLDVSEHEMEVSFKKVRDRAGLHHSKTTKKSFWLYAAAAIILVGAIGIGYLFMPHQIKVANGETQSITLADGTAITLNSGSELTYPRWYNIWSRTVTLNGEALFEVAHSDIPFKVKTGNAFITDLGTTFNVRSWSTDAEHKTSVFLKEGRASFSSINHKKKMVVLNPGEYSWISKNKAIPATPKTTESAKAMAWIQHGLSFDNQPLSAIFAEISRRFDVKIEPQSKDLLKERLTIYLTNVNNAEQTLGDICRAKGLTFTKNDDTFLISKSF